MSDTRYTYAVARIRAMETSLFSAGTIEQLLACKSEQQCIQFLQEKGWGSQEGSPDTETILNQEREKMWGLMKGLVDDMSVFDVLSYQDLFHNLKAAIKEVATEEHNRNIFYPDCAVTGEEMMEILTTKDYARLPENMREIAKEAFDTFLHTRDGQLCDIMIDKAALEAIYKAGTSSKEEIIRRYAESVVAVADIKIAVRSQKTAKSLEFMRKCMAECSSLNIELLAHAALNSQDTIREYLKDTSYARGAEALAESASAFERWCDDQIIETIRPQLTNPFSVGPLFAYILARENEIKTVRIILSGKQNDLPDDSIRERVREMYV